jgi:hypothetical protein
MDFLTIAVFFGIFVSYIISFGAAASTWGDLKYEYGFTAMLIRFAAVVVALVGPFFTIAMVIVAIAALAIAIIIRMVRVAMKVGDHTGCAYISLLEKIAG